MRKAALHNLGCKVNSYETEAMTQLLKKAGYEIVSFQDQADVYIINTCSVTNMADRKSRQMLHKAKKMNPEAVVVAAGCYVLDRAGPARPRHDRQLPSDRAVYRRGHCGLAGPCNRRNGADGLADHLDGRPAGLDDL